jgi:hypothetical protein
MESAKAIPQSRGFTGPASPIFHDFPRLKMFDPISCRLHGCDLEPNPVLAPAQSMMTAKMHKKMDALLGSVAAAQNSSLPLA